VSVPVSVWALALALSSPPSDYAGRYASGESVVLFTEVGGRLYVRPIDWSGRQPLEMVSADRFQMEGRPQRTYTFTRDAAGRVTRAAIAGMDDNGTFTRLGAGPRPLERLAAGDGRGAWAGFRRRGIAPATALELARRLFDRRAGAGPAFLGFTEAMAAAGHRDAPTLTALGLARVAAGDRSGGRQALAAAVATGSGAEEARRALRMLDRADAGDAGLPFPLDAVYAPPTAAEIEAVEAAWAARDLAPRDVRVEHRFRIDHAGRPFDVEIVSHLVHGSRHHGAILVPAGAVARSCRVLLEVKGVSWNFSPLEVPRGSTALRFLGESAGDFVIALPGIRGETLAADGRTWVSEGDPAETWDGAADDALAFLDVALQRTAAADPSRIAVFGRSRGGTVALLAGERDRRIGRVLAWSAPSGWIEGMPARGFTQREIAAEGLRARSAANEIGGQSVRTFLRLAAQGREPLARVRERLIASSPEYFVRRLPRTQAHWGADDPIVEPANAERIRAASARAGVPVEVIVHDDGGHDLDPAHAYPMSKAFLTVHIDR
jgi:alpha/beta hydrolase family protein